MYKKFLKRAFDIVFSLAVALLDLKCIFGTLEAVLRRKNIVEGVQTVINE